MRVPFFDLHRLYLEQKSELDEAVRSVLGSGHYILGKSGQEFEEALRVHLNTDGFARGCNSGTDALVLSLLASGVRHGDEVITVSHTAIPTITAIHTIGAKPVFVDVDPKSWLIDLSQIENAISAKTKALVVVHLYGNMADVGAIQTILKKCDRPDISIIEDVAQAMGSSWNSRQAGTQGRFGAFSFYPTKNIGALGDAGAVFCKDSTDAARIEMLRNYGQKDRYNAELHNGTNSRLDEIQAAILKVRLRKLNAWNEKKKNLCKIYRGECTNLPFSFQSVAPECVPAWHLCVVATETAELRTKLMDFLKEKEVQTLIHYPIPTHLQKAFRTDPQPSLSITEGLANRIVSLPMNAGLTELEQSYVIDCLIQFFRIKQ